MMGWFGRASDATAWPVVSLPLVAMLFPAAPLSALKLCVSPDTTSAPPAPDALDTVAQPPANISDAQSNMPRLSMPQS
jgi:hypothetical protein